MYNYFRYQGIAGLAQLVEQRIRNAWVGSSSLLTGTIKTSPKGGFLISAFLVFQKII